MSSECLVNPWFHKPVVSYLEVLIYTFPASYTPIFPLYPNALPPPIPQFPHPKPCVILGVGFVDFEKMTFLIFVASGLMSTVQELNFELCCRKLKKLATEKRRL